MNSAHQPSPFDRMTLAASRRVVGRAKTTSRLRHPMNHLWQKNIGLPHPMNQLRQKNIGLRHPMNHLRQKNIGLRHPMNHLWQKNIGLRHPMNHLRQMNIGLRHPIIRLRQTMSPVSAPMRGAALRHGPSALLNLKLGIDSRKKAQKSQKERGWRERLGRPQGESSRGSVSSSNPSFGVFCDSLRPITFPNSESRPSLLFHPPHSQPHQPCLLRSLGIRPV